MGSILHALRCSLGPYSRPLGARKATESAPSPHESRTSEDKPDSHSSLPASAVQPLLVGERCAVRMQACKPVVVSRVKWKYPSFDPLPFLKGPLARAAFLDPNALRLPPDESS